MFKNEEITQVFDHIDTVPFVNLAIKAFFVPSSYLFNMLPNC